MKKILLWLLVGVLCIISSSCNKPLIVESQTATETEVDVTVTRLIETNVTKNQTKLKYGYSYNAASGGTGLSLYPSSNSVSSTEYYAVLTDSNGKSYRFKLEGEDYFLLSEGQKITVRHVSYDPPSLLKSSEFFWGDASIQFDADVTEMIEQTTEDTND